MSDYFAVVTAPTRMSEAGMPRTVLEAGYLHGLRVAGLLPLLASPLDDEMTHLRLLDAASALMLTGGEDIDPARYGEEVTASRHISPERDAMELGLLEKALGRGLPVLAICRGCQLLNVALGGSLYQDLATEYDATISHDSWKDFDASVHAVTPNGDVVLLREVLAAPSRQNSAHHQGVARLAPDLNAVAHAPDGLVEAVEYRGAGAGWTVGVQWHPERKIDRDDGVNRRLFESFGDAARGLVAPNGPRLVR